MRRGDGVKKVPKMPITICISLAVLAALVYFPFTGVAGYLVHFATGLYLWIVVALAWNFIGRMGYISLAVGAWYGLGAYSTALLVNDGWNFYGAAVLISTLVALCAVVLSVPLLRLKSHYFIMGTFIIAYVIQLFMYQTTLFGLSGGAALQVASPAYEPEKYNLYFYFISLVFAALTVGFFAWSGRVRIGYAVRAIGQDEATAEMSGIPTTLYKLTVFGISSWLIAMAGAINGYWAGYLDAGTYFSLLLSIKAIIMSVLGGLGTIPGPMLGAFIIQTIEQVFGPSLQKLSQLVYGLIIVVVVSLLPRGIYPAFLSLAAKIRPKTERSVPEANAKSASGSGRAVTVAFPIGRETGKEESRELVRLIDAHKSFGQFQAVKGVSLTLKSGEIVGLIGPNGSGKTTVVNLLSGTYPMSRGRLLLGDQDATRWLPHKRCQWGLAKTSQIVRPFHNMTVFENVVISALFGTGSRTTMKEAREIAGEVLEEVGLTTIRHRMAASLPIQQLKLLEVAHALASMPKVLLLDEVLAGLTPGETEHLLELIVRKRNAGLAILFIEHRLQAVLRVSDRVMVLNEGKVLTEGTPRDIADHPEVMEVYLGLKSS